MKIRRRTNRKKKPWELDYGVVDGVRKRKYFATEEKAKTEKERHEKDMKEFGESVNEMDEITRYSFMVAKKRLAKFGASIDDAVEFFVKHSGGQALKDAIKFAELVKRCAAAKQRAGKRERYVSSIISQGGLIEKAYPNRDCNQISRDEVRDWIESAETPSTINTRRRYANVIFNWAVKERYLVSNTIRDMEKVDEDELTITPLTLDQCVRLLRACYADRELLPYAISGLFCGGRRAELLRSDMEESLKGESLVIGSKAAKMRSRRAIELHPVAVAWLDLCTLSGSFQIKNWRKRFDVAKKYAMSGERWPHNALRKTFATMHYAMFQDEAKLKAMMAHSQDSNVLHSNYRDVVTRKDAEAFWNLYPSAVLE